MASNEGFTTLIKTAEMSWPSCGLWKRTELKPNSLMARLWQWNTGWCPGWKPYKTALASEQYARVARTASASSI